MSVVWITILSALKLDGVIEWHWAIILIPLYLVILQMILVPLTYDIISTSFDHSFEEELDPGEFLHQSFLSGDLSPISDSYVS